MSSERTRNISQTAELNAFIGAQVTSGHDQKASELVRAALRVLLQRYQPAPGHLPRSAPPGRHARKA